MAENDLSVDARNVKVITRDGQVTLRGPVNSDEEKDRLAKIAAKYASPGQINNQLQVRQTPPASSSGN